VNGTSRPVAVLWGRSTFTGAVLKHVAGAAFPPLGSMLYARWADVEVLARVVSAVGENPYLFAYGVQEKLAHRAAEDGAGLPLGRDIFTLEVRYCYCLRDGRPERLPQPLPSGTLFYRADRATLARMGRAGWWVLGEYDGVPEPVLARPFDARGFGEAVHVGVFGRSGSGKTVLSAALVFALMVRGLRGVLVLDPQGEWSADRIRGYPFERICAALGWTRRTLTLRDFQFDDPALLLDVLRLRGVLRDLGFKTAEKEEAAVRALAGMGTGLSSLESWEAFVTTLRRALRHIYADPDRRAEIEDILCRPGLVTLRGIRQAFEDVAVLFRKTPGRIAVGDFLSSLARSEFWTLRLDPARPEDVLLAAHLLAALRTQALSAWARGEPANVLVVIDEAHWVVPQETQPGPLGDVVRRAVRELRKAGVGFLLISQSVADTDKEVVRNLAHFFIGPGLGLGSDPEALRAILGGDGLAVYETLPPPGFQGQWPFISTGRLSPTMGGASAAVISVLADWEQAWAFNRSGGPGESRRPRTRDLEGLPRLVPLESG